MAGGLLTSAAKAAVVAGNLDRRPESLRHPRSDHSKTECVGMIFRSPLCVFFQASAIHFAACIYVRAKQCRPVGSSGGMGNGGGSAPPIMRRTRSRANAMSAM